MFSTFVALCLTPAAPLDRIWLERLDPDAIPAAERFPWQPKELVGIIGTHRGRHWGRVAAATLSPDGTIIASGGSDRCVRLWSTRDLAPLACAGGHTDDVARIVFSHDGTMLATACDNLVSGGPVDRTVRLWRVANKSLKHWATLEARQGKILTLAFAADGKSFVAAAEDGLVRVWDLTAAEPRERASFNFMPERGPRGVWPWLTALVVSPDGKRLVTAISANSTSVVAWDVIAGKRLATLAEGFGWVQRVEFLPGGSVVQFHRPRKERDPDNKPPVPLDEWTAWDLGGETPKAVEPKRLRKEPSTAMSADGRVAIHATDTGVEVVRGDGDADRSLARLTEARATPGALSADGKKMVGFTECRVRVWDVTPDGVREIAPDNYPTWGSFAITFSASGDRLYGVRSGKHWGDEVFLTWELKGANPLPTTAQRTGRTSTGRVEFGPGGTVAAVSSAPSGGLYDVATGRPKSVVPGIEGGPYNQRIHALGLSLDGQRMVESSTGSFLDKKGTWFTRRTAVWDVREEKAVLERSLPDTGGNVTACAFTPDGKALMVGHQSGDVAWWDLTADPPKEVKRWRNRSADITALAVSPDGKEMATGSDEIRRGKIGEPGTVVADKFGWAVYTHQLQFTSDGKLLAKIGGGFVVFDRAGKAVVDLRSDRRDCSLGGFSGFAMTPDGRYVALSTGNGLIYILRLGK